MKNILLVAENKPSIELLEYINGMVESNNQNIRYKINQIKKVNKDKDAYPRLLIGNREINDINMIYIYLTKEDGMMPRMNGRRSHNHEDPYRELNFEDMLDAEIDYDDEGRPIMGQDHDDEQEYFRRKGGDESEDEPRIDINAATQRFNERRGNIKVPSLRKRRGENGASGARQQEDVDDGRVRGRQSRRPDDGPRRDSNQYSKSGGYKTKIKSRKSKYADESSYMDDSSDIIPNGEEELENFYMQEAKSRGQD